MDAIIFVLIVSVRTVNRTDAYGITKFRPKERYKYIYHQLSEEVLLNIVYYFDADYSDDSKSYVRGVIQEIGLWQQNLDANLDVLPIKREIEMSSLCIVDTRQSVSKKRIFI
jgi:hypothetical protein